MAPLIDLPSLHSRSAPALERFFERRGAARDVAQDLAQETWAELVRSVNAGAYDESRAQLTTFLFAIASNVWLRHLRRTQSKPRLAPEVAAHDVSDDGAPTHDALLHAQMLDVVRDVVGGRAEVSAFSDEDRALLRAVSVGRTDRDLALELGVSPSTAHARKKSVLSRLLDLLRSRGCEP